MYNVFFIFVLQVITKLFLVRTEIKSLDGSFECGALICHGMDGNLLNGACAIKLFEKKKSIVYFTILILSP
jgi:hypothetical protein